MSVQIKSSYIIKKIYSLLNERRKLEIIKYSKNIQNKLNINLINYRLLSGKKLIGNKNGICKLYNYNDNLLFEGEYLNGKKHGKGKEYNKYGDILFEGEYLNGKKWNGKGYFVNTKKYDTGNNKYRIEDQKVYEKDNSIFYYEIKDGKGFMVDYDDENNIFEGEYLNGERNGIGRDYKIFENAYLIYEGEYLNGNRNGKGKEYLGVDIEFGIGEFGKLLFEGEYVNGKRWNGKGYDGNENIVYEIKKGNGYIKEYYYYILRMEGEYINGEINGKEKKYNINNNYSLHAEFEGNYINGKKYGKGKEFDKEGNLIFEGDYMYNYKLRGTEYYSDGKMKYEGEYLFDQKWNGKGYDKNKNVIYEIINGTGKIEEYFDNGRLKYIGEFLNGKGTIKKYNFNGDLLYEGEYLNGEKNGKGKEYDYNDYGMMELIFEGEYLNGKRWKGKGKELFIKVNSNENLIYVGEYLNGKITGKGNLYSIKGNVIFTGEYLNGKRWNGIGVEFRENKESWSLHGEYIIIFEGEYANGKKNGKGKEYYFNGKLKFEGYYINNLKWFGVEYDPINSMVYQINNGNGFLKEYDYNGKLIYEGEYLNGKKWNGNIYDKNNFKYTLTEGIGIIKEYKIISYVEEIIFEGQYINGERNGKGKEYKILQNIP